MGRVCACELTRNVRRLLIALPLTAALLLVACGGGSSDQSTAASTRVSTPKPTTSAPIPLQPTAGNSSGTSAALPQFVRDIAEAWQNVKSYKTAMTTYGADGTTVVVSTTAEIELPNKEHVVSVTGGKTIEMIIIGVKSYSKIGGSWQVTPNGTTGPVPPVTGSDVINNFASPNVVKKGDDTVDGVKTDVYEITSASDHVATIWIGQNDHLPRKAVVKTAQAQVEVIFSDYGTDFGIKAPI